MDYISKIALSILFTFAVSSVFAQCPAGSACAQRSQNRYQQSSSYYNPNTYDNRHYYNEPSSSYNPNNTRSMEGNYDNRYYYNENSPYQQQTGRTKYNTQPSQPSMSNQPRNASEFSMSDDISKDRATSRARGKEFNARDYQDNTMYDSDSSTQETTPSE